MRKNKLLYIFITLVTMFTMGKVDSKIDIEKSYTCIYREILTEPNKEVNMRFVKVDGENAEIDAKLNFTSGTNVKNWYGKGESDKTGYDNKTCYKFIYCEGGATGSFAATNNPSTLRGATCAYALAGAANIEQKTIVSMTYDYTEKTKCNYTIDGLDDEVTISYNKLGEPLMVTSTSDKTFRLTAELYIEKVKKVGNCKESLYSCGTKTNSIYTSNMDSKGDTMQSCVFLKNSKNISDEAKEISNEKLKDEGYTQDPNVIMPDGTNPESSDTTYPDKMAKLTNLSELYKACVNKTGDFSSCPNSSRNTDYSTCNCNKILNDFNTIKNILKDYCRNIISKANSGESRLEDCLSLDADIDSLEFVNDSDTGECNMSEDMRSFLANIFRWVRYIIPVLVIILGLFDFMRAAASGTEDHMKKAQKQLTTRLIAAALIFLGPLVIAFFLEQFGFVAEGCGIIEL